MSGQRIDERWNIWTEYALQRRTATNQPDLVPGISGNAYDQRVRNILGAAEYAWDENTYLTLNLLTQHGDITSTTQPNFQIFKSSRAVAEGEAFGPNALSYRLIGTTYGFSIGISYVPTPHALLTLGYQRLVTHGDGGNDYAKSIPAISFDYGF